jgi:membrane protease YdiL (CAAX protease family)
MTRAAAARAAKGSQGGRGSRSGPSVRQAAQQSLQAYFKRSERPLQSLAFVLPLILIYEIGWRFIGSRLVAFNLLHQFFALFGATGTFLPAGALIVILLVWHIANGDKWTIHVGTLFGMLLESWLLTFPLLALAAGFARFELHTLMADYGYAAYERIIIAMGAGIYEELIFRLMALTLLHLLLVDCLRMPKNRAGLLMVLISGILFSLYHYLGPETFTWKTCLFRTLAGIYFGGIFICRGFGVTAGCHAVYDILILSLAAGS